MSTLCKIYFKNPQKPRRFEAFEVLKVKKDRIETLNTILRNEEQSKSDSFNSQKTQVQLFTDAKGQPALAISTERSGLRKDADENALLTVSKDSVEANQVGTNGKLAVMSTKDALKTVQESAKTIDLEKHLPAGDDRSKFRDEQTSSVCADCAK